MNSNIRWGLVLVVASLVIYILASAFFAALAILLFLIGIVLVGYGFVKGNPKKSSVTTSSS